MGTWDTKLKQVQEYEKKVKKQREDADAFYAKLIEAASSLSSAHARVAPAAAKMQGRLLETLEDSLKIAKDLSGHEKELAQAKKSKDKGKMKEIEGKMKPLIKSFDNHRSETMKLVETSNKEYKKLTKAKDALSKALAAGG